MCHSNAYDSILWINNTCPNENDIRQGCDECLMGHCLVLQNADHFKLRYTCHRCGKCSSIHVDSLDFGEGTGTRAMKNVYMEPKTQCRYIRSYGVVGQTNIKQDTEQSKQIGHKCEYWWGRHKVSNKTTEGECLRLFVCFGGNSEIEIGVFRHGMHHIISNLCHIACKYKENEMKSSLLQYNSVLLQGYYT